ncbi:glutathione ABC transporter substrate-binding protein [Roseibium litorale]|uniref:Glutathione-binding protein GsiB n=1 Tax=Roseibium litorale TaxID=2803841 RepID=A0ABR9CQ95_9HYPH|nr:glutathione ABC transporter substrate-binding protein [Roseibium litorale]MBD8892467.1 glutathione ABC transporter substrate-binding protein [Roseibium litorale]
MNLIKKIAFGGALILSTALTPVMAVAASLNIAMDATVDTLDPHDSTRNAVSSVSSGILERLIGFDKDMKLVPVLATSWEVNGNATQFTFHLRKDVMFHDGTPFNAEAVKVNMDRLADQSQGLKRNGMMRIISSTEVLDDYTVRIDLSKPFGAMLATLAHPSIVIESPAALKEYGKDVSKHPVGTGPFKFKEWIPGEKLVVEKFDGYWKKGWPKVDGVTFLKVKEAATAVAMLKAGEVQYVDNMSPELVKSVAADETFKVLEVPGITVWTAGMNMFKPEFKDPRVREAFNLAINKKAMIQVVFSGHGIVPDSPLAPNTAFYSAQKPYSYDLEKAKQLMKEAGYENGFKIEAWGRNTTQETRMLQMLKQMLAQINVDVTIYPMEPALRTEKLFGTTKPEDQAFGLAIGGWSPSTGDADWHLRPVYGTEGWIPKIYNMAFYSNPEVDADIATGLSSADPEVRGEAYADAQKRIWEDMPVIWLATDSKLAGADANLEGVYPMPDGTMVYSDAELK